MVRLSNSRFNPTPGIMDFWSEFRKPNPYRWPILIASALPFVAVFYWLAGETAYKAPERPTITYITTFVDGRSDAEIAASNAENQEVKELRKADAERRAERKRELYKALGKASGMDVEEAEKRGAAERAKAKAERQRRLDELLGDSGGAAKGERAEGERAANGRSAAGPADESANR